VTKCDKGVGGRFLPNIVWRRLWTASFLLVWDFCFFLVIVVSEVGVHSSGLCVEHSVYLYCSVLAVYLWRLWDIAVNLCFAPSIADFRHPFLLYCFTITFFRHPFLLYCFTVTTFLFFVCITWIAWLDSAVKCLICCIFHLSIHSVFLFCAFKVVLIHSVRISSSRESFIVASAGVWRGSWLFGVVVAAVVFSACARFLVSCTVLFWVWSISSWLWPLIPNLTFNSFSSRSLRIEVKLKTRFWSNSLTRFWSNSRCSVMFQCGLRCSQIVCILFLYPVSLDRWGSSRSWLPRLLGMSISYVWWLGYLTYHQSVLRVQRLAQTLLIRETSEPAWFHFYLYSPWWWVWVIRVCEGGHFLLPWLSLQHRLWLCCGFEPPTFRSTDLELNR